MNFDIISQNNLNKIIFYLVITIGIFLHLFYLFEFSDYYDDWNFFFTVDPNISNSETWQRHYYGDRGDGVLKEAFPWNFTYFTKYILKFIGYTVEKTHYFLLFFSIISYYFFYKVTSLFSKNIKFLNLIFILFATNLFLIREFNSFRPHSLTIFLSFLSIYFFILFFINNINKKKYYFAYIISTLLMLSFWPHTLALFGGQCIFILICFFVKKKNFLLYSITPFVIITLYTLLNYKYLLYLTIDNSWSYTHLNLNFFINFFFRSFFGSIIFGGFMLLIFSIYLIKEIKLNLQNYKTCEFIKLPILQINIKNFLLINTLTIYIFSIGYSLLKESVMAPKYLLILIPLIITWIGIKVSENKTNFIYFSIIIFSIINCIYYWKDLPIKRPPMREVLKIVNKEEIKTIYTTENMVFNNYLSHYNTAIENRIKVFKLQNFTKINQNNKIAIICLNYPRFAVGSSYINQEERKCVNIQNNENFQIIKKIQIPDFLIYIIRVE